MKAPRLDPLSEEWSAATSDSRSIVFRDVGSKACRPCMTYLVVKKHFTPNVCQFLAIVPIIYQVLFFNTPDRFLTVVSNLARQIVQRRTVLIRSIDGWNGIRPCGSQRSMPIHHCVEQPSSVCHSLGSQSEVVNCRTLSVLLWSRQNNEGVFIKERLP